MKLIGAITSPYVRKVRIVMAEKKLDYDYVLENVFAADTSIALSNPLGKVPCLVMEAGDVIYDSRVIVEYLDTLSPVGKLIPAVGRERAVDLAHPGGAAGQRSSRLHHRTGRGHVPLSGGRGSGRTGAGRGGP